jgi:hypothetical protein
VAAATSRFAIEPANHISIRIRLAQRILTPTAAGVDVGVWDTAFWPTLDRAPTAQRKTERWAWFEIDWRVERLNLIIISPSFHPISYQISYQTNPEQDQENGGQGSVEKERRENRGSILATSRIFFDQTMI